MFVFPVLFREQKGKTDAAKKRDPEYRPWRQIRDMQWFGKQNAQKRDWE